MENFKVEGKISKVLPNGIYEVELDNGIMITGHVSGKMRMYYIKIMQGDVVEVEMSPYDMTKGRIVFRKK
jgi:translation initiation factor IF-1